MKRLSIIVDFFCRGTLYDIEGAIHEFFQAIGYYVVVLNILLISWFNKNIELNM